MALQRFTQNPTLYQNSKGCLKTEKIDKSRNRFHAFMIVKVHELGMGDSMVIKADEMKAEMVNYIKQNMTIKLSLTLILFLIIYLYNSKTKLTILPHSNNYTIIRKKSVGGT